MNMQTEELKQKTKEDESITLIQREAYWSGWHAAMSEIIKILMRMQATNPKTPFD